MKLCDTRVNQRPLIRFVGATAEPGCPVASWFVRHDWNKRESLPRDSTSRARSHEPDLGPTELIPHPILMTSTTNAVEPGYDYLVDPDPLLICNICKSVPEQLEEDRDLLGLQ